MAAPVDVIALQADGAFFHVDDIFYHVDGTSLARSRSHAF
jgi:hypothetical protein